MSAVGLDLNTFGNRGLRLMVFEAELLSAFLFGTPFQTIDCHLIIYLSGGGSKKYFCNCGVLAQME